jgi:outer membrane autotransporter protein
MMSESSLTFDITSDVLLNNPIAGDIGAGGSDPDAGGLTKKGPALLRLTGDNTYSGQTVVEAGELRLESSVITPIIVMAGSTLSGDFTAKFNGSITNSGNIQNFGRVSPGDTGDGDGQIFIEGDFVNESTGTLAIDITPTGNVNDKIFLTGNGTINGGTLEVYVGAGNYISGTQYEVISGTVSGAFDGDPVQVGPNANTIDIEVTIGSLILTIISNRLFEDQIINSGIPSEVVKCILAQPITPGSDFAMVVEILGTLDNKQVNKALTQLAAQNYGSLEWVNARNNSYAADILSQHLFELCCSPRDCCSCDCNASVWVSVFGNLMDNKKKLDNLRPFEASAVGTLIGVDFCNACCFYWGAAFGYTHTDLDWRHHGGGGDLNSYYGALYGSWVCDCFSLDLSVLGGGTENDLKRRISFADINRKAKKDFWNYFVTAHLGLRANWHWCCSTFEPYALADYHYYTHGSFTEHGAESLNLRVKSKDQHMMRAEAGLKWYYEVDCDCFCWAPYLGASYVGEFPIHKSKQPASFVGQSCVINAKSYDSSVHLGSPQAGVKWTNCSGWSFLLGYKGLFNSKTTINEIEGRIEWLF